MRLRTFAAAMTLAVMAALPLAGAAFAADKNCDDFATKAEAQAAAQNGDPYNLDDDNDGDACETVDYGSASAATTSGGDDDQVSVKPAGGVETGGGPESALPGGIAVALGAAAAGGVGAVAARRFARR